MLPDLQRIQHILDYCRAIEKTVQRYGNRFEIFDQDEDFQRSISFSILQIGELSGGLSEEYRKKTSNRVQWGPIKGMRNMVAHSGTQLWQHGPPNHLGDCDCGHSHLKTVL